MRERAGEGGKKKRRGRPGQKERKREKKQERMYGLRGRHYYKKEVTNDNSTCFHKQKFSKVIVEDTKMVHESCHVLLVSLIRLKTSTKILSLGLSKMDRTRK